MKGIFLLWVAVFASVTPLHLIPFLPQEVTDVKEEVGPRLYGGKRAKYSDFPFMIFIFCKRVDKSWVSSGGCLVGKDWVLTSATSVKIPMIQPVDIFFVGGSESLNEYVKERMNLNNKVNINESHFKIEERRGWKIFIHPKFKYNDEQIVHNLAIVKTHKPFTLNLVKVVTVGFEELERRKFCTIVGWGLSKQTFVLSFAKEKEVSTMKLGCKYTTHNPIICLVNDDATGICGSDTGSPLLCNDKVLGVASYSVRPNLDCTESVEDYYTMTAGEKNWYNYVTSRGIQLIEMSLNKIFVCVFASLCTWLYVFN